MHKHVKAKQYDDTTDASLTLNKYIAVPIVVGQNLLGATTRRLFDEHVAAAVKALREMVAPVLARLDAINKEGDVETRTAMVKKFISDHGNVVAALSHDKSMAKELKGGA